MALIAVIILSLVAQVKVSTTFSKYSKYPSRTGHTAAEVARRILDSRGLYHVRIERVGGHLTDHFDPRANVLRLSEGVYDSSSAAAVGVAAHEVGHAIQHAERYLPIVVRARLVPAVSFASRFSWIAIFLGFLLYTGASLFGYYILLFGVVLFGITTLFQLVTYPTEINASKRALAQLRGLGWYTADELHGAKRVLSAAALTYLTSLLVSLLQLLRLIGALGRRR